ncbi:MAG TPA: ABC transporter permease [Anaerolineales bacterium]|nr:ABC transporter permease [Anaerolineales bacterium]
MMRYILRRLGFYLAALAVAIAINFFLPRLLPGDPATIMLGSSASKLSPGDLLRVRESLGLSDAPLPQQFITYLGHLFQGDFGLSYTYFPTPVTKVISIGFIWTLLLGSVSLIFSFVLGNLIGIIGSWRRGGLIDSVFPPLLILIGSFPAFFLALGLLYTFGVKLDVLPISHAYDTRLDQGFNLPFIKSVLQHMILPVGSAVLLGVGGWALGMRNVMVSVLADDYVTMAEAKGLTQIRIMFKYAARNALLPGVTGFGIALGSILSGQILIETVFSYPGLGFLLIYAVNGRDYPLMQGLFMMITMGILAANFLVDILYTRLDPRVRAG